jgi:UDP-N-acetylglucosamine--N-acetylmuramyl-(pentapeptide) pyrophosphoryl-undecaprenol N-acetylglucosamine transferase
MKIICAGGGTLGSVSPLLAVVAELKKQSATKLEVKWLGTKYGPERVLVEANNIPFQAISAGKFRRYFSWENIIDAIRVLIGLAESLWLFGHYRPQAVLTAGSFVAVPVGWAAAMYKVPVFVHQQDVEPGLANKLLAPVAKLITVTLPESQRHFPNRRTVVTGNPSRTDFLSSIDKAAARLSLGLAADKPVVLVIGGGTGALFFNDLVKNSLDELLAITQVVHITGLGKGSGVESKPGYLALPFTVDSLTALVAADVVVSRAGMGVITELAALSKPALIVPIPDSHQVHNADYLNLAQAAVVKAQSGLTATVLVATLRQLLSQPTELARLGNNLHRLFPAQAAQAVAREIIASLRN